MSSRALTATHAERHSLYVAVSWAKSSLLRGSISITPLRGLPEADQKKLQADWHETYIGLSAVVGAYDFLGSDQINLSRSARRKSDRGGLLGRVTGLFRRGSK